MFDCSSGLKRRAGPSGPWAPPLALRRPQWPSALCAVLALLLPGLAWATDVPWVGTPIAVTAVETITDTFSVGNAPNTLTIAAKGTGAGLSFKTECQDANSVWSTIPMTAVASQQTVAPVASAAANGTWYVNAGGFVACRINVTAISGGTETFAIGHSGGVLNPAFYPNAGGSFAAPLLVPAGTAAAPGLGVGTAVDGLYNAGSHRLGFATNGVNDGVWDSGNLIIGAQAGTAIMNGSIAREQIIGQGNTPNARIDIGHWSTNANKAGEVILFHSCNDTYPNFGLCPSGSMAGVLGYNVDDGAGGSPTAGAIYTFLTADAQAGGQGTPGQIDFDTGDSTGALVQRLELDDSGNVLVGPFGSTVKISDKSGDITGPSGAFFPIPTILTTSQAQLAAGSTTQAFADVTGLFVNEVIYSGFDSSNFLDGTQIVSLIGTVELSTTANGTSTSGQKVITVNDTTNCVTGMAVASGAHLTAGSLVTSINPGVSITIDKNLLTNITNGTAVVCDPVAVMNFASTSANTGGTAIDFYRQFPGPSFQSSTTGLDASFFGDLGVAGYGYVGPSGTKIWDPTGNLFGVTIAGTTLTGTTATIGTVTSTTALNATGTVTLSPGNSAVTISPTGGGGTLTIAPGSAVGTINRVSIGQTTPEPGSFTTASASGLVTVGSNTAATGSAGELAGTKIIATATAPGAGYAKIEWVAGTNAGSCKLIAYAGTSTTPVTIVDNVGTGC